MPIPGNMLSSVTEMVDPNTSGWVAMSNCTIGLGTGGRNGPGCLAVKSVAAGEMRARTVSSYAVDAGVTYQTFADTAGPEVERIGIRWLTAANVEISITWSLLTAASSTGWHRVGVAGAAPAGASRAQVVVSSSPVGAAVTHFWENVYLGLPVLVPGNLLDFNTGSVEVDTTGWAPEANTTLSRTVPLAGWPVDFYTVGGHALTLAATGAGNASARTSNRFPVSPGTDYRAACYLSPPLSTSVTWIELRFYDAAGTQLVAARGPLAAPGTGFYLQTAAGTAPPTAVTCEVAVGITSATAGQVMRVEGVSVSVAVPLVTGSVIPLADASFEMGVGAWTRTSGVATLARSTPWGSVHLDGSYALTLTSTTATASTLRSGRYALPAGAVGQNFRLKIGEQVTAGGWTITMGVRFYDPAGTDLGLVTFTAAAAPSPGWWLFTFDTGGVPTGAAQAAAEITFTATSANSILRMDSVALWQTLPQTSVVVTPSTASARLTLRDLHVDYRLRLYRVTAGGTRTLARGPTGLYDGSATIVSDTMVIEDYEAPLGVAFYYLAEFIDPLDLSVDTYTSSTVTIPHDDINSAWIKDPGNPQRNAKVTIESAPEFTRPIDQATYVVKQRRNKIVLSGLRNGREGTLTIWTTSDQERDGFHWLLDSGNTLLWQTGPGVGVGNMYVNVGEVAESRGNQVADDPFRTWTLPLVEADMPVTTGVNGSAGRTWQDILSEFATWGDLLTTYATWEDVLLNKRRG